MELKVARLKEERAQTDLARFQARYPGLFLVAMGVLSAEEQEMQLERRAAVDREPPRAFGFGDELRVESTPLLADSAFYLEPRTGLAEWKVGRDPECDICIADSSVSSLHGVLTLHWGQVSIRDCGSTNGTRVNFQLVTPGVPEPVAMTDMLTLGRYTFWLLSAADVVTVIQCGAHA
jgi:hypothetical protein